MDEHPNATLLRNDLEAFARGDMDAVMAPYAEDVIWRVGGQNALSGVHRGRQALLEWFGKVFELGGEAFEIRADDVMAEDRYGMMFLSVKARRGDEVYEGTVPNAFRFEDGKIVESWFIPDDQTRWDAFWSPR